jgi:hypothetical protein
VNPGPLTGDDAFNPVQAFEICVAALGPEFCVAAVVGTVLAIVTMPAKDLAPGTIPQPGVTVRSKSPTEAGRTNDTGGMALKFQAHKNTCSFTPDTQVTTDHGKQTIGTLHVGHKVLAYNPKTGNMEL